MATLTDIDKATLAYANCRRSLAGKIQELNDKIDALKREALPLIRRHVNYTAETRSELVSLIESNKYLFDRPRTQVFHGVRVGLQKGRGKLEWEDSEQLIKMIRKICPEQVDVLIKTTEKPVASALNQLETATLRKLGLEVSETGDQVVIKPTDSEVDKIVNALLKDAEEDD
jgi:hypothetical protein